MLNRFAINSFWSVLGAFISRGVNFIVIIYIAKSLGANLFGTYNVILATTGLFGAVSGLGLGLAATKLVAELRNVNKNKTGIVIGTLYALSIIISICVSIVFYFSSSHIAINFLKDANTINLLRITSIGVIFDCVAGVQNGILSGFEDFKNITKINILSGGLSSLLMFFGVYYFGILGLMLMLLFSKIVTFIITRHFVDNVLANFMVHPKYTINKLALKPILNIGIPSFLSSFSTSPVNWVANLLFVNQPQGYMSLGIYNVANQFKNLVLFLPDSAGKISIPMLSSSYGVKDFKRFQKLFLMTILWNLLLSIISAVFIFLFSFVFKHSLGAGYIINNRLIFSILFTSILIAVTNAMGYVFICSELMWYDFLLRLFWGGTLLIVIIIYGRYNGALGYSNSILIAYLIFLILQVILIFSKVKFLKNMIWK